MEKPSKRRASVDNEDASREIKRSKRSVSPKANDGSEDLVSGSNGEDANFLDTKPPEEPEDEKKKCTDSEKEKIDEIRELLKQAYEDLPLATHNPNIYTLFDEPWDKMRFDPNYRSLAFILHKQEGWTAEWMKERIGSSPSFIGIYPLGRAESRALCEALNFRYNMNLKRNLARMEVDIPEKWLEERLKYKNFKKKGAEKFGKRLAAKIAFNQSKFFGRDMMWFRPLMSDLGWEISESFVTRGFLVVILVVAADPALIESSTKSIKGKWSENRGEVKKAFIDAAKAAERKKKLKYPQTFALFKKLFPSLLN